VTTAARASRPDVIIVGGGHNGLVGAAYLAEAGQRVTVLETRGTFGGAVAGARVFDGVDATVSRFSYLVSLLPDRIVDDLGLDLELRSRRIATFTPVHRAAGGDTGILVDRTDPGRTQDSFRRVTGSDTEYEAWQAFHTELAEVAQAVAPTLIQPLRREAELAGAVPAGLWSDLVHRPIGEVIERRFTDDTVRGILLTDALIGIDTWAFDPTLRQNRCFLYHVIGNGTGEWKVAVGGMAAVASAMEQAARRRGVDLRPDSAVTSIAVEPGAATVTLVDGTRLQAPVVLANCAPATLAGLLGEPVGPRPEGAQVKVNLIVRRLPAFRAPLDPADGFAGTLHLNQGYAQLARAHAASQDGRLPDPLPAEVYCHSLTDPSILSPDLRGDGWHTLTLFGLHTPARLFAENRDKARTRVRDLALATLADHLAEPLEDCLATDVHGQPCVEVMVPQDVEDAVGMPDGHIFHGDLDWPWLPDDAPAPGTPAERWGVATGHDQVLLCGSGARRGGAVSGIGGHNAAMAVLGRL